MNEKVNTTIKHILFIGGIYLATYILFIFFIIMQIFDTTVSDYIGEIPWYIIYFILPIIVVIVPLVAKYILKFNFKKAIICAVVAMGIYSIIALGTDLGVTCYFKDFTPQKWIEYPFQRHYMLKDLTNEHNLIGMTEEELYVLLGSPSIPVYKDISTGNEVVAYTVDGFIDPVQIYFELKDNKVVKKSGF